MSIRKLMIWASVLTLIAAVLVAVPTATQAQSDNLLQNPGFELPYTDNQQAGGWERYRTKIEKPTDASALQYSVSANFSAETNPSGKFPELIHGGEASQHIGQQQDPWIAGVKQTVGNIPAGSQVVFCAFNRIYANNDKYGKSPSVYGYEARSQVGILPDGGGTVDTPGIVWSSVANPHDNWQQICTPAVTVGGSGTVTVFTHNDWRGYAAVHLDSWWDDASLTVQGQAQPTAQPTTAAQPQPQPTAQTQPQPQPQPGGGIVHTVVAGDTLFGLSLQYNVPLDQIYALNGLNSQSILSIGQKIIIKAGAGTQVPAQQPTAAPTAAPTQSAAVTAQQTTVATPAAAQPTAAPTTVAGAANMGTLCLFAYNDANADGLRDPGEQPVAGAKFTVVDGQGATVAEYASTDSTDPHCISDLTPGSYNVTVQPAPNTTATSDERWGVPLTSGSKVNIDFGSRSGEGSTTSTGSSTAGSSSGGSSLGGLVAGIGGLVLLLAAGVIGAFVIARRRA